MTLVQRNWFLHGSIFCLFLIYTLSNASLNSTNTITLHSRVKRDHGSCVTGMSMNGAISAGDANTLNAEANSGGGRGRGKRSVDSIDSTVEIDTVRSKRSPPPPPEPQSLRKILMSLLKSMPKPFGRKSNKKNKSGWFATRTQEIFSRINHNPSFAQSFKDSESVQSSEFLSSRIIVNPRAVTCNQLCSYPGSRYGLVGFCTPDYCQCFTEDAGHWNKDPWAIAAPQGHGWDGIGQEKERSCNKKKVFDPVRLMCADPTKTELCSDHSSIKGGWIEKI